MDVSLPSGAAHVNGAPFPDFALTSAPRSGNDRIATAAPLRAANTNGVRLSRHFDSELAAFSTSVWVAAS